MGDESPMPTKSSRLLRDSDLTIDLGLVRGNSGPITCNCQSTASPSLSHLSNEKNSMEVLTSTTTHAQIPPSLTNSTFLSSIPQPSDVTTIVGELSSTPATAAPQKQLPSAASATTTQLLSTPANSLTTPNHQNVEVEVPRTFGPIAGPCRTDCTI